MTGRGRWWLAVTALAAVAAAAFLLWPRPAGAVQLSGRAGEHDVRLLIETPAVGTRTVTVEVAGPAPVERLVVVPTMVEMGHAAPPVTATEPAPGHYRADEVEFFMAGRWDVEVVLDGPAGPAAAVFPVLIAP